MKFKINKFILLYVCSILLLILILILSVPISEYSKKIILDNNQFVKNQIVINPETKSSKIIDRMMTIRFNIEIDKALKWDFKPLLDIKKIKVGENNIIKYEGINLSTKTITATADFIIDPIKITPYLIKTECFCFTKQTLAPGESQIFAMVFFLDPSLDLDKELDKINDLVFTYQLSEYKS